MKLSNLNISPTTPVSEEIVSERKRADEMNDDSEDIGVIPGISPDDPDYQLMKKRLGKIKKRNAALYNKMMNGD